MEGKEKMEKKEALRELEQNIDIIKSPAAMANKEAILQKIKLSAKNKSKKAENMDLEL
jgi:hypothetical protein